MQRERFRKNWKKHRSVFQSLDVSGLRPSLSTSRPNSLTQVCDSAFGLQFRSHSDMFSP